MFTQIVDDIVDKSALDAGRLTAATEANGLERNSCCLRELEVEFAADLAHTLINEVNVGGESDAFVVGGDEELQGLGVDGGRGGG